MGRNIEKNYSPHIQPDIETASATVELRRVLLLNAREAVQKYLLRERAKYHRDAKGSKTCKVNILLSFCVADNHPNKFQCSMLL